MHETLIEIQKQLETVVKQLQSTVPNDEPFGNVSNNWSFPGLCKTELIEEVQSIIALIKDSEADDLGNL